MKKQTVSDIRHQAKTGKVQKHMKVPSSRESEEAVYKWYVQQR